MRLREIILKIIFFCILGNILLIAANYFYPNKILDIFQNVIHIAILLLFIPLLIFSIKNRKREREFLENILNHISKIEFIVFHGNDQKLITVESNDEEKIIEYLRDRQLVLKDERTYSYLSENNLSFTLMEVLYEKKFFDLFFKKNLGFKPIFDIIDSENLNNYTSIQMKLYTNIVYNTLQSVSTNKV